MTEEEQKVLNAVLLNASYNGDLEIVQKLVKEGADVKSNRNISLIYAAESGHLGIVKFFIVEHKSDPEIALKIAKKNKKDEVIEWCETYIKSKDLNDKLENGLLQKTDEINKKKMKV